MKQCLKNRKQFTCCLLPCVVGVATGGLIFQLKYFIPSIKDQAAQYLLETFCIVFYVMCFFSYYRAIVIKNSVPQTIIPPRVRHQLFGNHPFYTQKKFCDHQNRRYKPLRTSHCHICKCVTRMDHHCPYTDGCVGSNNFKAFILFCFYGGLFALEYLILSAIFYSKLSVDQINMSQSQIMVWMFFNLCGCLLTFSMNGLWISNLTMACKNITQLDLLKGQFKFQDKHGLHPNPYDVGTFSNVNSVFNGDFWLFWWPSEIIQDNDSTDFPMRPPVTPSDLKDLPDDIQAKLKLGEVMLPKSIKQLRQKYESEYEGVTFFYHGKQFRVSSDEKQQGKFQLQTKQGNNTQFLLENSPEKQINSQVENHSNQQSSTTQDILLLTNIQKYSF